ncbi:MAG TPA: hypothetical protein VGQ00_00280 [Candidatus Norongarragalinales archaeon]|jgi:hypothetical protein|nr:hypothetical protein [Candidatus Norongarragalinales archaeon]
MAIAKNPSTTTKDILASHGLQPKSSTKARAIEAVVREITKAYNIPRGSQALHEQARAVISIFKDQGLFGGMGRDTLEKMIRARPAHALAFFFLGVGKNKHFRNTNEVLNAMRACDKAIGEDSVRFALENDAAEALEAIENMHIKLRVGSTGRVMAQREEDNPLAKHLHTTMGGHYDLSNGFIDDPKKFLHDTELSNAHLQKQKLKTPSPKHWRRIAEK